ncbi:MBL fold metallo-hydrolase [Pseudactinotalea sp. Z1732]|uniref:MBL fold metallo-hydrolase n=1 Tax=Pseudactinotalea sp. Z1732 TaxID=3413026 RepID=UPI003C7B9CAF
MRTGSGPGVTRAWRGGAAGTGVRAVLAPNPGPMTLEGTNTWVLRAPGPAPGGGVVVDPGPAGVAQHLAVVHEAAGPVALTLLTHHHRDHTGAVAEWTALTGSAVRGADSDSPLREGERIQAAGWNLEVLATPGHTADSVCLLIPEEGVLLTGDTVLGRGTSVVPWPEGHLGDYLDSLTRLISLAREGVVRTIAPGHGPVVTEPLDFLNALLAHRRERLDQVDAAVRAGARTASEVVTAVYGDLGETLALAATATVRAQLVHLGHDPA